MLNHVCSSRPAYVADFAFGDGRLLKAAQQRWPNITPIGADISSSAVSDLREIEPLWQLAQCDFLEESARLSRPVLSEMLGKTCLVLLNPPFSCKGGSRCRIEFNGEKISCSLAMAFVLTSVPFLSWDGEMIAVLPAGSIQSEKDRAAWNKLCQLGSVEVVDSNDHNVFEGCTPRTIIIRFIKGRHMLQTLQTTVESYYSEANTEEVHLYRGKFSMNIAANYTATAGTPLVHSTELKNAIVNLGKRFSSFHGDKVVGPVVLLHRVGKPSVEKICLYSGTTAFLLSDCVLAMQCHNLSTAESLFCTFKQQWELVERSYGGTCARYITVEALSRLCLMFGFNPIVGLLCQRHETGCT